MEIIHAIFVIVVIPLIIWAIVEMIRAPTIDDEHPENGPR